MTSTLREVWVVRQKRDVIGSRGYGVASVLDVQILSFLLKKFGFAPLPDIMLSQSLIYYSQEIFLLNLTSDSEVIL